MEKKVIEQEKELTMIDLAVTEIEKFKFNKYISNSGVKVGLTYAIDAVNFLRDNYIECECGHTVEHKFSHTNEDGQVTCSLCVIEFLNESKAIDPNYQKVVDALNELVQLKDMKGIFEMESIYKESKPKAWENARQILKDLNV